MKTFLRPLVMGISFVYAMNAIAQVPLLKSLASAQAVIFLDFDGHLVEGTSWNYSGPINCAASGLNNTQITTVFNRVAEDYRPFNVNVTTDSTEFLAAPLNKRVRVIITVSNEWYGSAGGVAFIGSFTWGDDTPCFIFSSLLNYNVKNISEATSHETGHTLGLFHQAAYNASCVKTSDYNYGTGAGEIGWAPIMGVGYYQNLTSWYNGPNSYGCNSYQNDMEVITSSNGFGYRADDYSATFANAITAPFLANEFIVDGMIGQNSDQDMIRFTQPGFGRFQLTGIPYNVGSGNSGSNLDLQISLYNSSETLLNVFNPGTLLSSVIDTSLNAGVYYLKIEGRGNIYTPDYSSLGSYKLQGNFTAGIPLAVRRVQLHGEIVSDKHKLTWLIDADEAITKQTVEISTDGRKFSPVTQSANDLRSYMYKPSVTEAAQYRLNVVFDNGKQYYSNVVSLRNSGATNWPKLLNNISNNNISINSPGSFNYTIYEFDGKAVRKGQLSNGLNSLNISAINGGMYIIRFSNNNEQLTDKFIKL